MADNDWKKRLGVVFSTNPDFTYQEEEDQEQETLEPSRQNLIVSIDRKGRGGKQVTLVTGFVGTASNDPIPLSDEEVYAMGGEKKEIIVNYEVGDTVRILDGPLSSFTGKVDAIDVDGNAVSVIVSMFGRETAVEFELDQVEVVSQ